MRKIQAIVLAAGKGRRMNGSLPKVLLPLAGKTIIYWTLELIKSQNLLDDCIVVVGYRYKDIIEKIKLGGYSVGKYCFTEQKGTADAVRNGVKLLSSGMKDVLVLYGDDSSLYKDKTIRDFIHFHRKTKSKITIMSVESEMYKYLGGLDRDSSGKVTGILTAGELVKRGVKLPEILCGAFCFDVNWLKRYVKKIQISKVSGEYPLPAIIELASEKGYNPQVFRLLDKTQWTSVNTKKEYDYAKILIKKKLTAI